MFTLCSSMALLWGLVQAHSAKDVILDYRIMDLGARCLLQHRDLYSQDEMIRVYQTEDRIRVTTPPEDGRGIYLATMQVYPPTSELIFAPFALLPWPLAYTLWIALTFTFLTLAAFLMWHEAQHYASDPAFYLVCIVLVNSGVLFGGGNPAGIAVSLCIIASWCILQQRFMTLGMWCMAVSLLIKPHDGGFVWLYLLLLGGAARKYAIRSLAITAGLGVGAILWVSRVSPHWIHELKVNLADIAKSYNDPAASVGAALMVNLQTAIALFWPDPHVYNMISLVIMAPLFLIWLLLILRYRLTREAVWHGLASIAVLSLLPIYHRPYDAKILLLMLPACSILWARGGLVAWAAMATTLASIIVTSDLPVAALSTFSSHLTATSGMGERLAALLETRPASPILLASGIFYLSAFMHRSIAEEKDPVNAPELQKST